MELLTEEQPDQLRPERKGAGRAHEADPGDDGQDPAQPGRKSANRPAPRRRREPGQERGLHGLEQEHGHAGHHNPGEELGDGLVVPVLGEDLDGEGAGVQQEG